jgi:hypothetical protein
LVCARGSKLVPDTKSQVKNVLPSCERSRRLSVMSVGQSYEPLWKEVPRC